MLEMFLIDNLRSEIPIDPAQYEGMKQCCVNHLLVDLQEEILRLLDSGSPAVALIIDY